MNILYTERIMTMIQRALNLVDRRLVDHGIRVASVMKDMLAVDGCEDRELLKKLSILALLHDVGAYRTEEIDNLVRFETTTVWEHSVYGYLFIKEFTPMGELAKVILYHHANFDGEWHEPEHIMRYAQILHVADRVAVWHDEGKFAGEKALREYFDRKSGTLFSPEAVKVFWRANEQFDTLGKMKQPVKFSDVMDYGSISQEEALVYLEMLVHAIDFRSRFTVSHTFNTMEISYQLACRMGMSEKECEQIYYGALMHDLGKIGTPIAILEKPGKLTDGEMAVMRDHVTLTRHIIEGCVDETVARIALRHHEKLDGKGYPLGIPGEELTLQERLVAVADVVSALCRSRSYKDAFPKERVLSILHEMRDRGQIDGTVVAAMEEHFDEIVKEADAVCVPIWETYERMAEEYREILEELKS